MRLFVVTGIIVIINVALRRLEMKKRIDLARTIDRFAIWCYPIGHTGGVAVVALLFFA